MNSSAVQMNSTICCIFFSFCSRFCLFWFTVQKLFEFMSSVILISLCHLRYCACYAACFSKFMVFEKMLVIFLVFVQILFLLLLLLFLMNKRQKTFMIIVTWDGYLQTSVRAKTKFACLYVNYMYVYIFYIYIYIYTFEQLCVLPFFLQCIQQCWFMLSLYCWV